MAGPEEVEGVAEKGEGIGGFGEGRAVAADGRAEVRVEEEGERDKDGEEDEEGHDCAWPGYVAGPYIIIFPSRNGV